MTDTTLSPYPPAMADKTLLDLYDWAHTEWRKQLRGEPSEWDQHIYMAEAPATACGTACCLAGRAVLDVGAQPQWLTNTSPFPRIPYAQIANFVTVVSGNQVEIHEEAQALLGLTESQANLLFDANNDIGMIYSLLSEWGVFTRTEFRPSPYRPY